MVSSHRDLSALNDNELISLSRTRDGDAFGELIRRHYRTCERLATSILRHNGSGQDEVQKACWSAFEHIDQYQETAAFSTWLCRIVVNECLMVLRSNRRVKVDSIDGENGSTSRPLQPARTDPEYDLMNRDLAELIRKEMGRMAPMLRNMVVLRDIEGLSMGEIANRHNITIAAAKSRLLRARKEVRVRLERNHGISTFRMHVSSVRTMPARSTVTANVY